MKRIRLSIFLIMSACTVSASAPFKDSKIEGQVDKVLSKMTLEQKAGQMIQLVTDLFGNNNAKGEFYIDENKTDSLFKNFKIGSILNAPNTVAPTAKEWERYVTKIQKSSMRNIGIPCLLGLDQNHGSTYTADGTLFPQNINMAASFNRELTRKAAEATAYETRAANIPWTFNPTVDLGRDARWPRIYENFGEDAYMNSEMGVAAVLGFQGTDPNHIDKCHIAACMKHYMGYGVPWTGKDRTPAFIAPSELREKHFAPFLAAVQNGVHSVMVNSASVNGLPMHANKQLLNDWLKVETNWDGMLITDWADVNNLWQREMIAKDKKEALAIAINAGIDMIMEPYNADAQPLIVELVKEGKISQKRIDDAVRRILRMKIRLDLFNNPTQKLKNYPDFGGEKFAKLSYQGALESEILLKNTDNILPLKKGQKILLTGPNANSMRCLDGGWSYTWQGNRTDEFAEKFNTIYEAFCNKFGKDNVNLVHGVTYNQQGKWYEENTPYIAAAVAAAKDVDIIVACIGENSYTETPGNLNDLTLSHNQRDLVKELSKTGKPIVLVLNEGRPRLIADIEPLAKGVIDILLPGSFGADALVDLMAGDENFSAKMPYTYPSEINSLANYDFKKSQEVETMEGAYDYDAKITQQWGFGYGQSYTTYKYSNLRVDKTKFTKDDVINVSVDITNTGGKAGKEPILLYSSDVIASMVPDGRRLRGFDKVALQPGETKTVTIALKGSDLAFVNYEGKWTLEEGDFVLHIANLKLNIACSETYTWQTANR